MPSDIDNTIPADGVDVAKSPLRLNWTRARNELNHGGFITHEPDNYTAQDDRANSHFVGIDAALATAGDVPAARRIDTEGSIEGGGDFSIDRIIQLINDEVSPGANKVYGTDGSGVKGFKDDGGSRGAQVSLSADRTFSRATHGSNARFLGTNISSNRTVTLPADEGLAGDQVWVRLRQSPNFSVTVRVEDPNNLGSYEHFLIENDWIRLFQKNADSGSDRWWTSYLHVELDANKSDEFRSSTHGSGYTVQASDRGRFLTATSAITFSFPAVSTLAPTSGRFFACEIHNASGGNVTLDLTGATNVIMAAGDVATVLCRNGGVFVVAVGPNLAAV